MNLILIFIDWLDDLGMLFWVVEGVVGLVVIEKWCSCMFVVFVMVVEEVSGVNECLNGFVL